MLRVSGRGAVTILDPQRLVTNSYEAKRSTPLLASGIILHVLPAGAAYDLTTRELRPAAGPGLGGGRRRARRGAGRPAADGPRHRRRRRSPATLRRRLARKRASRKTVATDPSRPAGDDRRAGRSTPVTERPTPDLDDPGDPRLPRPQRLVLRQGDPPGGRPRRARAVPHRQAPRLHRAPARGAARPLPPLLLARPQGRLRRAPARGHLARTRHRAHGARPAAGRRPRHPARQDPRGEGRARPLQRHLRLHRRERRPRGRPARGPAGQPPRPGRPGVRLGGRSSSRSSSAPSGRRSVPRRRRSSTRRSAATSPGSGSTSTPWCSSARASTPSGSGPR